MKSSVDEYSYMSTYNLQGKGVRHGLRGTWLVFILTEHKLVIILLQKVTPSYTLVANVVPCFFRRQKRIYTKSAVTANNTAHENPSVPGFGVLRRIVFAGSSRCPLNMWLFGSMFVWKGRVRSMLLPRCSTPRSGRPYQWWEH